MFPFDQPFATSFYLVLYLATLVLHVVPMNYVLAGSTFLAGSALWQVATGRSIAGGAIDRVLRDWMPFALSVTITMGIAPLLFLQILYKESFYTANLLLFHRWMAILPVLITAFYLLYVQKSKWLTNGRAWRRLVVSTGILACFAFVAWSWTENHLLATRGQQTWTEQYATGGWFYGDPEVPPRLALWYLGAFPVLAMITGWQLRSDENSANHARSLATIALAMLIASGVAAVVYGTWLPAEVRSAVLSQASPYLALVGVGAAVQAFAWIRTWRNNQLPAFHLMLATAGALLATTGMTVVREVRRLVDIDLAAHYDTHAQASQVGGLTLFLLFLLLNTGIIAGIVMLIRREISRRAAG